MTHVSEFESVPVAEPDKPVTVNVANTSVDYGHLTHDQETQIENLFSQLPVLFREAKSGYKTTEFWLTIVTLILLNVNLIPLPDSWQGIASAALVVVYAISRGLAKKGVPDAEPIKQPAKAA